jgi:hypothetical protein
VDPRVKPEDDGARGEARCRPSRNHPDTSLTHRDPIVGLLAQTVGLDCSGGSGLRIAGALVTSGSRLCAALGRDDLGEAEGFVTRSGAEQSKSGLSLLRKPTTPSAVIPHLMRDPCRERSIRSAVLKARKRIGSPHKPEDDGVRGEARCRPSRRRHPGRALRDPGPTRGAAC